MSIKKDVFTFLYWYPFRIFIQKIPVRLAYFLAKVLGIILYYVMVNKRFSLEEAVCNISGDGIDKKRIRKIVQMAFVNFCQGEAEVMFFSKLNEKNIKSFVECSSFENLDKGLSVGKGVILLFAHFGANQMIMPAIGYNGYKMSQLSAPATVWVEKLPNRQFSRMEKLGLKKRWEQELSLPVKHINIFGSMKEVFLSLKRNEIVGIAIDGGGGRSRVIVDFLGRKAFFSTGAIEIAIRTDCVVLPTFIVRNYSGKSKMIIESPLEIDTSIQTQDAIEKYIFAFTKRLEEYVYRYPCHYSNFLALRTFMEKQGDIPFFIKENNSESITGQAAVS